ncbi:MAG: hypothetical protein JWO06_1123 [Bacteroidota bacterium]|nr:hypothetical protein [Bacteroidota bacterium]
MKPFLLLLTVLAGLATQGFSQGFYIEFKITANNGPAGSMVTYSRDGDTRSEVTFGGQEKPSSLGKMGVISLTLKDKPNTIYTLNADKKTYSETDVSNNDKGLTAEDYEVTVIGKEKMNGYNATHVKIKIKKFSQEQDMWVSSEVPAYADFVKIKTKYTGDAGLSKALEAKGTSGFPVRILVTQKFGTATIDLVKAEKRSNPASLFSLDGYTKTTASALQGSPQEMMEKIKNMSPEERQKYLEEMKKQYGK